MSEIERLRHAIRHIYGVDGTHVGRRVVREGGESGAVREIAVEVFALRRHQRARVAYAWGEGDGAHRAYTAVLGIPPIGSARDAVRSAREARSRRRGETERCDGVES